MTDDTQAAAAAALEQAITDWLIATHDGDTTGMILEGYVIQVAGRSIRSMADEQTIYAWDHGQHPVDRTLGLTRMLSANVRNWYDSGENIADDLD